MLHDINQISNNVSQVPDRGGRPSTMNPLPPEMPSFRRREEAPKNQRPCSGRDGGQRGGGYRGGRGKVQGGMYRHNKRKLQSALLDISSKLL